MGRSFILIAILGVCFCAQPAQGAHSTRDVFDPATPHTVHIRLSAAGWDAMQPGGAGKKAVAKATREEGRTAGVRLRPNSSGYAYVLAEMEFDGQKISDVGIRFKGNSSYAASAGTLRRPMKVDFDRFIEGGRFAGLESFNFSNTTYDPSQVRESVAFWLYRKLDVPASRTGFALVYLSVAGKFDREFLGLYTLIEEIDQQFLKEHFGNNDGLLLKPSGMRGLAYLGETWDQYAGICSPRGEVRAQLGQKIVDLARLTHRADDATFRAKVGTLLAVDEFLRYVAVTSAVISFDSFLSTGHNYYMYVNPADGLIYFIPWDLNMTFGGYGWVGTVDELARTDIARAYADHNILIERLLAVPEYASAYRAHVYKLSSQWFNPERMRERRGLMQPVMDAAEKANHASGRVGNPTTRPVTGTWPIAPELWPFIEMRAEWIRLQLEGNAIGFKPDFREPKRTLLEWAAHTVAAVAFMDGADLDHDRRLSDSEIMAAAQRLLAAGNVPPDGSIDHAAAIAALDKLMSEDLRRRVPAKAWADWLFAIADGNKDGRVSAAEMLAAYKRFQASGDTDRDGLMDGRELVEQMGGAGAPRDPDPLH
jgi:spore coat protein H